MEGYILQWTDDIDGGLHPAGGKRERGRERERERERDRQTDRQTDRQRQADREGERQTDRQRDLVGVNVINLIYIAQFDTNGILTALYIVITYIQMQYVHVCTYAEQSYKYAYTCLHIRTYTVTCTNIHLPTY